MNYAVTANYVAALFIFMVLLGIYNVRNNVTGSVRWFRRCTWICLIGLINEGTLNIAFGNPKFIHMSQPLFFISLFVNDCLILAYAFYLQAITETEQKRPGWTIKIVEALLLIDFLYYTISLLAGKLFYIHQGTITAGPWSRFYMGAPMLSTFILVNYIIHRRKQLGAIYTIALCSYFYFSIIIPLIFYRISSVETGYLPAALGIMMNYVFIQSQSIAEANVRAETYNRLSVMDVLTGLKNRRGFSQTEQLLLPDEELDVLFIDLNGLKYINDTIGHDAGDNYIKKMADLLRTHFPDEEIFRISGDEFVVLHKQNENNNFEEQIIGLKKAIAANEHLAACGYATGKAASLHDLLKQAEMEMYIEKDSYYDKYGRKQRR